MPTDYDRPFFIPADTEPEAVNRIYALTGRASEGTRGEKRALLALRDALDIDVDIVRTSAVLGESLARALDLEWDPREHVDVNRVTLGGLNLLLEGATEAYHRGSLRQVDDNLPPALTGREWRSFRPARSKIEAVTRIAALTNAPKEWLGPGGKEHKSALTNLAAGLFPGAQLDATSKTRLAAALAGALGVPWTDLCYSTGETITLWGLNSILAGAERHLGRLGEGVSDSLRTAEEEGSALAAALLSALPRHWDGRTSVSWLARHGLRGSNDNEWQGFYGEEQAKIALAQSFTPGPHRPTARYGNTTFDYALNRVWDIKVHTETKVTDGDSSPSGSRHIWLNDEEAIRRCVSEQGLGFLIISGAATMDVSGEFLAWHRAHKAAVNIDSAPSNSGRSRMRKSAFAPVRVEAFWIADEPTLDHAIREGALEARAQGRQAPKKEGGSGAARRSKLQMNLASARKSLRVSSFEWPPPPTR